MPGPSRTTVLADEVRLVWLFADGEEWPRWVRTHWILFGCRVGRPQWVHGAGSRLVGYAELRKNCDPHAHRNLWLRRCFFTMPGDARIARAPAEAVDPRTAQAGKR